MADSFNFTSYIPAAMTAFGAMQEKSGFDNAAAAARLQGSQTQVADQFQAQQLEIQAGQTIAASQRQALEQRRQAKLVEGRAIAVAAAGGGGATDPTVVNLISRIHGEGAYRAGVALYNGEDAARSLRMKAAAADYEGALAEQAGQNKADAYETQGTTALLKGASSIFSKYGFGSSKPAATNPDAGNAGTMFNSGGSDWATGNFGS